MRLYLVALGFLIVAAGTQLAAVASPLRDTCSKQIAEVLSDASEETSKGLSLAACLLGGINGDDPSTFGIDEYYKLFPLVGLVSRAKDEPVPAPQKTKWSGIIGGMTKDALVSAGEPCSPVADDTSPSHSGGIDHDITVGIEVFGDWSPQAEADPWEGVKVILYDNVVPQAFDVKSDALKAMVANVPCTVDLDTAPKRGGEDHLDMWKVGKTLEYLDFRVNSQTYFSDPSPKFNFEVAPSFLDSMSGFEVMAGVE